jgi:GT2 family glycosyltransferase
MASVAPFRPRAGVDGKFFRSGGSKFHVKGVAYGPFAPNAAGQPFASPEQTAADLAQIRELGANLIRVYHVPAKWFLDLAAGQDLKVLVDVPWTKEVCFLDSSERRQEAIEAVRRAVYACGRHPAVFGFSVVNEIPPDVVRWSGAGAVADFIDDLVQHAKQVDPECLCTFTNYPPTEFLRPQTLDFICFNVYLHDRQPFRNYLARLQMLADGKPLVLGEVGVDSLREGEARKSELLAWQIEDAFRGGLAGVVVFSYTDDWWRGERQVTDWGMGLTTSDRRPKPSFGIVRACFQAAPYYALPWHPKVSVVVAAYNAGTTLKLCLESLRRLNYPDYEVILVDDGSTDATPQIGSAFPGIRYVRHPANLGLSAARNTGIAAATGEIIAFTDADCRADEDWLHHLVGSMLESDFAGMGGPNLLPPDDSPVAAAVMASPGGPAHVMLSDRQAEHIPGCNMAFFRKVLEEIGGFDPVFRKAGDDVDLCWRLQQAGYRIGFAPSAFVWHYRRSTVGAYLRQQRGYGESEALLVRKHPEYFNSFGGSIWRGRIYAASRFGLLLRPSIIYRGLFGSAGFQSLYASEPALTLMLFTAIEYHVLVTLPLWVLTVIFHHLLPLAAGSLLVSLGVCVAAGGQASLPRNKTRRWSRPLVALLFFMQPIVRGWARYRGRMVSRGGRLGARETLDSLALEQGQLRLNEVEYATAKPVDRLAWVRELLQRLDRQGWPNKADVGWSEYDVEVYGTRWSTLQIATVAELHRNGTQTLRCRLKPRWSFQARTMFWSLCGFELLALGIAARRTPWPWLVLLSLPLIAWWLHRKHRAQQSMFVVFLDKLAADFGYVKPEARRREAAES